MRNVSGSLGQLRSSALFLGLFLSACAGTFGEPDAPRTPSQTSPQTAKEPDLIDARFTPVPFSDLSGWAADDHGAALAAFRRSCERILARPATEPLDAKTGSAGLYGTAGDWQGVCRTAASGPAPHPEPHPEPHKDPRQFFEQNFVALSVEGSEGPIGLFTGYFEPEIEASLTRGGAYQTPLLTRPDDLQKINLGDFDPALAGQSIRGRIEQGRFVPYPDRSTINRGALSPDRLAIAWVKDPVDAFFTHIQGSARLILPDGRVQRVGFAEKNGRPYTAIGKILIDQGELSREEVSMQTIRTWLAANPQKRDALLEANKSYIFFNKTPVTDLDLGPVGAGGVPLTAHRSLAVDRSVHALGAPIWLQSQLPGADAPSGRLMVAQDTGSAIVGPVRGDYFWGSGMAAGEKAGVMKSTGRIFVLVPPSLAQKSGLLR
ncbi:MAG: MltA domain-containing protein [Parvibaculum sp.]